MYQRVVICIAMLACVPHLHAEAIAKPDVLMVVCDQWSPRCVSWNDPQVRTPNLDGVARDGVIFDRCYTLSPVCMPAGVSLVTRLYPHNHNLWGNAIEYHVAPDAAPMFRDIHQAGASTAQIGKLHWYTGSDWKKDSERFCSSVFLRGWERLTRRERRNG